MKKPRYIYFAHSMTDYGSEREERALDFLSYLFTRRAIDCPSTDRKRLGCDEWSMDRFCEFAASHLIVIGMPNKHGYLGKGTYQEMSAALKAGRRVLYYEPNEGYLRDFSRARMHLHASDAIDHAKVLTWEKKQ